MQANSDAALLREYAEQRSEPAFGEIVARHTGLVYSAALRQVGSPDLARDIAQSVFTDLARKARMLTSKLDEEASLAGWLYRGTRYATLTHLRDERRRQTHERQVMKHFDPASETSPDWERVRPVLDEAMASLSDADRDALLLRFFKNQDFRAVGAALGVSDDAAQKRVTRSLDKLRAELLRRGVTTTAAALSTAISIHAVQAAPAGLVAALTSTSLAGAAAATATSIASTTTATATKAIAMTTLQKALAASIVAVSVGTTLLVQHRTNESLRTEIAALRQQTNQLAELEPVRSENQRLAKRETDADELARLRTEHIELLRLRGELGVLRRQVAETAERAQEAARATKVAAKPPVEVPAGSIKFIAYDVQNVLPIFAELAGLELDVAPELPGLNGKITFENEGDISRAEAVALFEKALREQAGLVVRRSVPGRATVLFDESERTKKVR